MSEWDVAPSVKRGEPHRLFVEYEFEAADILLWCQRVAGSQLVFRILLKA
jgi:hypothetical protein